MGQDITPATAEAPTADADDFESFFSVEYQRLCQALFLLIGDRFEAD